METHKSKRILTHVSEGPTPIQPGTHEMVRDRFKAWQLRRKISEPSGFKPRVRRITLEGFLASPFMTNRSEQSRNRISKRLGSITDESGGPFITNQADWEIMVARLGL